MIEDKNTSVYSSPCIASFQERTMVGKGGIIAVHTQASFSFYRGRGQVGQIKINDPPREIGYPLLTAILESAKCLQANMPEIFPFEHVCPGILDDKTTCGGKHFKVVLDRRLDGIAILRLTCEKCGAIVTHDFAVLDTRLMCCKCGEVRPDVKLATLKDGEKKSVCDDCFQKD